MNSTTEAELQKNIIELARITGWRVAHFRPALMKQGGALVYRTPVAADGAGFPDLVLARNGKVLFIECKSQRGELSDKQNEWLAVLPPDGTFVFKPDDWDKIVEILSKVD
jgi:hypothetical protein